jgi:hypothetical protein
MPRAKPQIHAAEFWTGVEAFERIHRRKMCVAQTRGDCQGQIVGAHTIPRSQLRQIASNGHVYYVRGNPEDLAANNGRYTVGKRGVGQFSVLNFFCAAHDREIFSHLENDPLTFDSYQLSLLHYRAMAAELYKKMNAVEATALLLAKEQGRRPRGDRSMQAAKAFQMGQRLGLRDMAQEFPRCETALASERYEDVSALVVRFKRPPSIMTVGGFAPEFDYDGSRMQTLGKISTVYHPIGLSVLAAPTGAAVAFTWLRGASICRKFAESFMRQDRSKLSTLIIQTAFEHLENTCMSGSWWDGLLPIERDRLIERMQFAGSPEEERTSSCLQYCGVTFDQWQYDSHVFTG